jgi:hypothetical protein
VEEEEGEEKEKVKRKVKVKGEGGGGGGEKKVRGVEEEKAREIKKGRKAILPLWYLSFVPTSPTSATLSSLGEEREVMISAIMHRECENREQKREKEEKRGEEEERNENKNKKEEGRKEEAQEEESSYPRQCRWGFH